MPAHQAIATVLGGVDYVVKYHFIPMLYVLKSKANFTRIHDPIRIDGFLQS
jgi:hypothetical protein